VEVIEAIHTPVLLEETLELLSPREGGDLMVDATVGEGGHAWAFLSRFPALRLVAVDADGGILRRARERLAPFGGRVRFFEGWSEDFFAAYPPEDEAPGRILIDLGISRYHYEISGRGFSFRKDEPLDMRLDTGGEDLTAADLLARLPERELADLIFQNGEERYSRRIARRIVETRRAAAVAGSRALAEVVEAAVPGGRQGGIHPATRTFQALRIAVNRELERLPGLLALALRALRPGGRLGVISFHSLEDRIVKNVFRGAAKTPIHRGEDIAVNQLTRKGVAPGEAERRNNPPSRSARLRVVEKIERIEKIPEKDVL